LDEFNEFFDTVSVLFPMIVYEFRLFREADTIQGIVDAGMVFLREFRRVFDTSLAYAASWGVDNSKQVYVVVVVGEYPQVGKHVSDFLALKKTKSAWDPVRYVCRQESFLDAVELVIGS